MSYGCLWTAWCGPAPRYKPSVHHEWKCSQFRKAEKSQAAGSKRGKIHTRPSCRVEIGVPELLFSEPHEVTDICRVKKLAVGKCIEPKIVL